MDQKHQGFWPSGFHYSWFCMTRKLRFVPANWTRFYFQKHHRFWGWCRGIASLRFSCWGTLSWAIQHRSQDYLGANSHTSVVKPLYTSVKQRCLHYMGHLVIGKIENFTKEKFSITISGIKLIQDTWYLWWFCQLDTIQNHLRRVSVRDCLEQVVLYVYLWEVFYN